MQGRGRIGAIERRQGPSIRRQASAGGRTGSQPGRRKSESEWQTRAASEGGRRSDREHLSASPAVRLAERASVRISELEDDAKYTQERDRVLREEIVLEQCEVIRSSPAFNGRPIGRSEVKEYTSNDSYMSSLFIQLSFNHARDK